MRSNSLLFGAIVVAALCLGASYGSRATMSENQLRIYYLPFNYETFIPVTMETIEDNAICVLSLSLSDSRVAVISEIFESALAGQFDENFVRVKIVGLGAADTYVDRQGGIFDRIRYRQLDEESLERLDSFFAQLAHNQGCDI